MPIAHITKIRGRRQLPVTNKNCDFCVLYCWNPDSKNQYRYLFCVRISMHTLTWEHGLSNFTANCTEKKLFLSARIFIRTLLPYPQRLWPTGQAVRTSVWRRHWRWTARPGTRLSPGPQTPAGPSPPHCPHPACCLNRNGWRPAGLGQPSTKYAN